MVWTMQIADVFETKSAAEQMGIPASYSRESLEREGKGKGRVDGTLQL